MAKKWYKHWVAESLRGTIRFDLTSEERGVWWDLLAMAAESRHEGYIAPNTEQGYPDAWIAAYLNVPLKLLKEVIDKNIASARIERTPFGLHILNWTKYQSEYDRQKPYRQADEPEKPAEQEPAPEPTYDELLEAGLIPDAYKKYPVNWNGTEYVVDLIRPHIEGEPFQYGPSTIEEHEEGRRLSSLTEQS